MRMAQKIALGTMFGVLSSCATARLPAKSSGAARDDAPYRPAVAATMTGQTQPDATVTEVSLDYGFVILDKGRRDSVERGDTFIVQRAGVLCEELSVEDVYENYASAHIVRTVPGSTIQRGDTLSRILEAPRGSSIDGVSDGEVANPPADQARMAIADRIRLSTDLIAQRDSLLGRARELKSLADKQRASNELHEASGVSAQDVARATALYGEAVDVLTRTLTIDAGNAEAYMLRGLCRALHDLDSNQSLMITNAGVQGAATTFSPDCLADCQRAVELAPMEADVYWALGHVQFLEFCNAKTIAELLHRSIDLDLGLSAIKNFDRALELDGQFAKALYDRGRTLVFLEDYAAALRDMRAAQQLGFPVPADALKDLEAIETSGDGP